MTALAFDTETGGFDWFEPSQRAFLVTWADAKNSYHEFLGAPQDDHIGGTAFERDVRALRRGDRIWGHNLKFDLHHVRAKTGFDVLDFAEANGIELWDSDSLDRVLNPGGADGKLAKHGLKELDTKYGTGLAQKYDDRLDELAKMLGLTANTPQRYWRIYQAFPAEMLEYARYDARATYDLGEHVLLPQLADADDGLVRVAQLEREVLPVLYEAERLGVMLDQEQVGSFHAQFNYERIKLVNELEAELGETLFDFPEPVDFKERLVEALLKAGVPLTERTESGDISTDKKHLAVLAPQYKVVENLLELRRVERFLSTYIEPMVGREVLHTDFQQQEAWTGRMSSRRPNMQNWPQRAGKEVRNVLRARPGHKLVVADYSQMEAMIIVRYLNNKSLIDAINGGLDMNSWMAAQIWGGEPHDWRKDGPKAEGEQSRKTARHTLYATLYGAGAGRVTQQLPFLDPRPFYESLDDQGYQLRDIDTGEIIDARPWSGGLWPRPGYQYAEARQLIRKIKQGLPGYKAFLRRLSDKIDRDGFVSTYYGRKNPINRNKKYVAVAGIVQGTGADILKLAAVKARPALRKHGGTIIMLTHDELVAEVPEANAEAALAALTEAMETAAPDHNPHMKASGHILDRYGED